MLYLMNLLPGSTIKSFPLTMNKTLHFTFVLISFHETTLI